MRPVLVGQLVADLLGRLLDDLDQRRALRDLVVGLHVPVAVGVLEPELQRVQVQLARDPVHLRLEREVPDRHAEAAHGATTACGWCTRTTSRCGRSGCVYGPGHVRGGLGGRVRAVARVRAGVGVERDLAGDDRPVVHHAVLDVDALGRARGGDLHLLVAVVDVLDRLARLHRGDAGDRLDDHVDLAAEPAADRAADDLQLAERHVEDERRVVEREERRLRVGVDLQAAVVPGLDDAARRLRRRLLDRLATGT